MAAHKLTRKDLKQDSFVDWVGQTVDYIQDHFTLLATALLVVVVLAVGVPFYRQGQVKAAQRASYLLYQGETLLAKGLFEPARERLQECLDRFSGTSFAKQARLDLANVLMSLGENEAALATLDEGLSAVEKGSRLQRNLLSFKAAALENLERYGEAEAIYRDLLTNPVSDRERFELSLRLADTLKAVGKTREGLVVLEELQDFIDSGQITLPTRDLESRLQLFRALASPVHS